MRRGRQRVPELRCCLHHERVHCLLVHTQTTSSWGIVLGAGDPNSQWAAFEEQKAAHVNVNLRLSPGELPEWDTPSPTAATVVAATWEKLGPSKIVKNQRIGVASDFWNRYEEDIQLAKDLSAASSTLKQQVRNYI